jgi:folate-binding protein YgfZ
MADWIAQYRAVRERAGRIDRSRMGAIAIRGADRYTWLQGMVSQDVRRLQSGDRSVPACLLTATGHVISDLTLVDLRCGEPEVMALLPPQIAPRVLDLLDGYVIMEDVELRDAGGEMVCWSFQGPLALERLARLAGAEGDRSETVFAAPADRTGSGGYDLYSLAGQAGAEESPWWLGDDAPEVGAEAEEALRIEAGIPLFGAELDESVIALEANLGPTHVSLTKGCYVGQEILARIDSRGHTNRALTGIVGADGFDLQPGARLFSSSEDGAAREAGRVTSVLHSSPAMEGRPIALAFVRHEFGAPGTPLRADGPDSPAQSEVVPLPFYRLPGRRPAD